MIKLAQLALLALAMLATLFSGTGFAFDGNRAGFILGIGAGGGYLSNYELALAMLATLFSGVGFAFEGRKLRKGTSAMKLTRLLIFGTVLLVMCFVYACEPSSNSEWECVATVTDRSDRSRTATGSGTGSDLFTAQRNSVKAACSKLNRIDCDIAGARGVSVDYECDAKLGLRLF